MSSFKSFRLIMLITIALVMPAAISYLLLLQRGIKSAYLEWGTAEMIVAYSECHAQAPPRAWSDLESYFEPQGNLIGIRDINEIREYITINFDLLASKTSPFGVATTKSVFGRNCLCLMIHVVSVDHLLQTYYQTGEVDAELKKSYLEDCNPERMPTSPKDDGTPGR